MNDVEWTLHQHCECSLDGFQIVNREREFGNSQGATYVRLICRQSNVYPDLRIAIFIITNTNVNITHPKANV